MIPRRFRLSVALLLAALPAATLARADEPFSLKNGDRVVFYGDSITDQRLYTTFTETYVVTRFPKLDVSFVHSGWGGDRVTGGGGGPIDLRLKRDVFAYKPTVMTVMLGMNDASYRAFDQGIFDTYSKGMEHIVDSVKSTLPGIRVTLIQPSPFDDVTRKPNFEGGYNAVLVRYGEFVKNLARRHELDLADLNTPVVEATKKALSIDPDHASKLIPDRVHPAPSGQILMAESLLKSWHAPALVSEVKVHVENSTATAETKQAKVSDLVVKDGTVSWTQLDDALPFPIDLRDPLFSLAAKSSDVVEALDRQPLQVIGLNPGTYYLSIDGKEVGTFTAGQLLDGLNLATLPTPMYEQARKVHGLTLKHNDIHFTRWRSVQVPLSSEEGSNLEHALTDLDKLEADVVKAQREAALPVPHKFAITPVPKC